jgi:small subunit ribosomal protein S5
MGFEPNSTTELKEKVIHIGRVSKTVKGGRNFR